MDITVLSQHAVSRVAHHLGGGADPAADALHALLRDRLSRTAVGTTALNQLREQPQDAARRHMVAAAVAEQANADPAFADMLRWAVGAPAQQGRPPVAASGPGPGPSSPSADAGAILVNRDPSASCHGWEVLMYRQNGRWVIDLPSFSDHYVAPQGTDGYDCDVAR